MSKFLLVILFGPIMVGCSYINEYFSLPDDNVYEEVTESAIKYKTGLDVDLTPSTLEK